MVVNKSPTTRTTEAAGHGYMKKNVVNKLHKGVIPIYMAVQQVVDCSKVGQTSATSCYITKHMQWRHDWFASDCTA